MKANNVISIIDYKNSRVSNTLERQLEQLKVRGYTELAYFIELGKVNHPLNKITHVREEPSSGLATVGRLLDNPKGSNSI